MPSWCNCFTHCSNPFPLRVTRVLSEGWVFNALNYFLAIRQARNYKKEHFSYILGRTKGWNRTFYVELACIRWGQNLCMKQIRTWQPARINASFNDCLWFAFYKSKSEPMPRILTLRESRSTFSPNAARKLWVQLASILQSQLIFNLIGCLRW
jgi:hypothetical protein